MDVLRFACLDDCAKETSQTAQHLLHFGDLQSRHSARNDNNNRFFCNSFRYASPKDSLGFSTLQCEHVRVSEMPGDFCSSVFFAGAVFPALRQRGHDHFSMTCLLYLARSGRGAFLHMSHGGNLRLLHHNWPEDSYAISWTGLSA